MTQLGRPGRTVLHREYERRLRAALGDALFAEVAREEREFGPNAAMALGLGGAPVATPLAAP
jgi:hypothetical protein